MAAPERKRLSGAGAEHLALRDLSCEQGSN